MARPSRILVVEDDESLRETIGEVLADEGHEIRLAGNGHDALETLMTWHADLVILDLMMPLMDAYGFREAQLATGGTATSAKVLVLSAARDLDAAAERLDADAWLAKPFTLSEMIGVIDDLLLQAP